MSMNEHFDSCSRTMTRYALRCRENPRGREILPIRLSEQGHTLKANMRGICHPEDVECNDRRLRQPLEEFGQPILL
jgi:hypothetical protein